MLPNSVNAKGPRPANLILCAALALALSACGGGGGNPGAVGGGGTPTTPTTPSTPGTPTAPVAPTVEVSFFNSSGQSSNALSASTPLTARATIKDASGKPVPEALVTFTTDNTLALLSPSTGTSLTDSNGVATIKMLPASLAAGGAAKLTATATVAGATVSAERNYSVGATALTLSPITLSPAAIPAYGSTVVSVGVLADGASLTGQQLTVNFTSVCLSAGKATLATSAPTSNGIAKVVYRDLGCAASDTITATTDGAAAPATQRLEIGMPAAASVMFTEALPVNQSIVIKGQGGNLRTETATLKFKVFDIFNRPLQGQNVTFDIMSSSTDVILNKAGDISDQNGEVITSVNSGTTATTFRVIATIGTTGISTISDQIVVTTGLPIQAAFTLGVETPNIEGWTINNIPTTVGVLLADRFGNPVADGTPIVFQTNMGAIGTSDKGGCNLINGACSVPFRSQNPRTPVAGQQLTPCNAGAGATPDSDRVGLATICASTTDGVNTLSGKTWLFFSGSDASNVYLNGETSPLSSGERDLGTVASGQAKTFTLQINDVNNNPMPSGTTVQVTSLTNASIVDVIPATVQGVFPSGSVSKLSPPQGSRHRVSVLGNAPTPCVAPAIATFNVTITSPVAQKITTYPFRMTVTCP